MDEIILDLGEYGSVLVEPTTVTGQSNTTQEGLVQAGVTDAVQRVTANARELLKRPLAGLGHTFVNALPNLDRGADYQLEQFTVEFNVGLAVSVGADAGAVAKLTPNGAFKCTYTWKRQPVENMPLDQVDLE